MPNPEPRYATTILVEHRALGRYGLSRASLELLQSLCVLIELEEDGTLSHAGTEALRALKQWRYRHVLGVIGDAKRLTSCEFSAILEGTETKDGTSCTKQN